MILKKKKLFLISVHQNDSKYTKKLNFNKKIEFFKNTGWPTFPNAP